MTRQNLTRQAVMMAIQECTNEMGCVPTITELMKNKGIDRVLIRKHFGNYKEALEACNLEIPERGRKVEISRLFEDWTKVVRLLKKLPTGFEYERNGK